MTMNDILEGKKVQKPFIT